MPLGKTKSNEELEETKGGKGRLSWLRRAGKRLLGQEPEAEEEYERPLLSVDCSGVMGSVQVKLR